MKPLIIVVACTFAAGCSSSAVYNYKPDLSIEAVRLSQPIHYPLHLLAAGTFERIGEYKSLPFYSGIGISNSGIGSPAIGFTVESDKVCIITRYDQKVCEAGLFDKVLLTKE